MKAKKIIIAVLLLILCTSKNYAQQPKAILINDNLEGLFINKDNGYGSVPLKAVEKYLTEISNIYYFEIVYKNKVLFRETIRKTIPQHPDTEIATNMFRFKYDNIYLDASLIADADKIQLLESPYNKLVDVAEKKFLWLNNYEIFARDYSKSNPYQIKNPTENIRINVYRVDFE
ncbi:hypothetical protein [Sphingobacterium sp. LRF_L2]|uniref:hypothetical protein n=1 Tax=Sphingobacterium sp. LRF_L2 TaxID=3369421 RepID=UPI003F5D614A